MKTKLFIIIGFFCLSYSWGQSKRELKQQQKAEKEAFIKNLIDSKQYTFTVNTATSYNGSTFRNVSEYDLTIKNDSVFSYLPYFGRSFSADFSSDGGIDLESPMQNFEMKETKKRYEISFEAEDAKNRTYDIILSIGKSGFADLSIRPENKTVINYDGEIKELDENLE